MVQMLQKSPFMDSQLEKTGQQGLGRINLHLHSTFSDGSLSPGDILNLAARGKMELIGFCDHFKTSKVGNSLSLEALEEYSSCLRDCSPDDQILCGSTPPQVLAGLEIDSCPGRTDLESLFRLPKCLDYLLFEYIGKSSMGGLCLKAFLNFRKNLPFPVGLAHTHLSELFRDFTPAGALELLEENNIFLEVTGGTRNHLRLRDGTPIPLYRADQEFYQALAQTNVKISLGTDCHHDPREIWNIEEPLEFIRELKLWKNLISF